MQECFYFSAPESVKKIFSVAHLGKKEYSILVKKELIERVQRHKYDETTAETKSKLEKSNYNML